MYLTLTRNGQFTVNKFLMEHIGVKLGDPISVRAMPDGSFSVTARNKKRPLSEMRGAFRHIFGDVDPLSLEDMDQTISEGYTNVGKTGLDDLK
ncbi:MAG: AbrB/MazE/SpoVT family DNA-binding domain-containing protein [Zoogloeaceae bacterium]|nr:AbrB/MazE/SpoVT family DNA-binding domain-containing protein [Zoogloeaceae bacterium]